MRELGLALATMIVAVSAAATPAATLEPSQRAALKEMERAFAQLVAGEQRAGVVWEVAKDGNVVSRGAVGWQDREARVPMSATTTFRLYSMSRAVTSVAALRLVERGRLSLDAPLADYLPRFAEPKVFETVSGATEPRVVPARRPIVIRDLLTYRAGFGYAYDYPKAAGLQRDEVIGLDISTAQGIDRLASVPLLNHPGERWHYGFASDVLGRVIEVVTGEPLDRALRTLVFEPLGMDSTGFVTTPERLAKAYGPDKNATLIDVTERLPKSADYLRPSAMHSGGGGLVSTAHDYLLFCEMLRRQGVGPKGRLLRKESIEQMVTDELSPAQGPLFWHQKDPSPIVLGGGWGLGVGVRARDVDASGLLSRRGEIFWGGLAGTGFFVDPASGLSGVVMTQYLGPDGDEPALMLRRGVYGVFSQRR